MIDTTLESVQKKRIKGCFNKAWNTYDRHCCVQKKACKKAIEVLMRHGLHYKTIADFACGTGISTQYIVNNLAFETLYAIDFSENLLEVARRKSCDKSVKYLLADFDDRLFPEEYLDLIFCNMGLQWSLNLSKTLDILSSYLNNSGLLVFTLPVLNVFDGYAKLNNNFAYDPNNIGKLLEQCQFQLITYHQETYVESYGSQLEALRSIKSVGANCLLNDKNKLPRESVKKLLMDTSPCDLTYHINIFVAKNGIGHCE